MPLDQSYVGRAFPLGEPYAVGIEKIREFAAAIGDDNPVYRDRAAASIAGFGDVIAPPTFAIAVIARAQDALLFDPALGLDFSRVVHRDQTFTHARPIRPGDLLSCTVYVDSIRVLAGNDVIVLRTEVLDDDGLPVCTAVGDPGVEGSRMTLSWADLAVGDALPPLTLAVTRAQLVRYAGASGDFNPIHWNDRTAQHVGLPGVIAHGMLTMALAGRIVTDWLGDPFAILDFGVTFTRPVVVPDDDAGARLELTAVVGVVDVPAGTARIDITAKFNGQTVLTKARATIRLR